MFKIGQKVKLRNGKTSIIVRIESDSIFPVKLAEGSSCKYDGKYTSHKEGHTHDIIEIVSQPFEGMVVTEGTKCFIYYDGKLHLYERWGPNGPVKINSVIEQHYPMPEDDDYGYS